MLYLYSHSCVRHLVNRNTMRYFLSLLLFSLTAYAEAQIGTGSWREHLPYNTAIDVAYGNGVAYCATPFAVFSYTVSDQSIERISKVNKLSGSNISSIAYDSPTKTLLVAYETGVVDLIVDGSPFSLRDIAQSDLLANKRINEMVLLDGFAYLCTGYGVSVMDLARREIRESWFIDGQSNLLNVFDLDYDAEHWYAATSQGLFTAERSNPFLVSFEAWEKMDELPLENDAYSHVAVFGEQMYLVRENDGDDELWVADRETWNWTIVPGYESLDIVHLNKGNNRLLVSLFDQVREYDSGFNLLTNRFAVQSQVFYPRACIYGDDNRVWLASSNRGLLSFVGVEGDAEFIPEGPPSFDARRISAFNNNVWIASGGVDATWTNKYNLKGIYGLVEDRWQQVPQNEGLNDISGIRDYMSVSVDPSDNQRVFLGSWEEGLVEVYNGQITTIFNESNSPLQLGNFGGSLRIGVAGTDFDSDGRLWFTNAYTNSDQLHMRTRDGNFFSYDFNPDLNTGNFLGDVMVSQQGHVWAIIPRGNGLLVMDTNETPEDPSDDNYRILTNEVGEGALPNMDVFCIEEDLNGEVWVGTLQGLAVFYAPDAIFGEGDFDAQQILIEQDGNIQVLLETEQVNCIEIDGGNRKWVGTEGSGVFLFSPNGQEELQHFTVNNSPLLSNVVYDIAINHGSGEIFFATDRGVLSLMSDARNFDQDIEAVKVYPNPVREDYTGLITIDGLAYDSDVRITDVSGNLVHVTRSNGGRAVWDGNGRDGRRVNTGVYLVFCSSPDGEAAAVGKVAIVR